jgi:hypothetical protein
LSKRKRRIRVEIRKQALRINGEQISAAKRNVALFACLYRDLGRVVPYERLLLTLGYAGTGRAQRQLLRQYLMWVKDTLATHKAPYVLAVATDIGYALCELAEK